jgi:hypothetical protein
MEVRLRFGSNALGQLGAPDAGAAVSVAALCTSGGDSADPAALAATARPVPGDAAARRWFDSACGDFDVAVGDDASASAGGGGGTSAAQTTTLTVRLAAAGSGRRGAAPPPALQLAHVGERLVAGAAGLQGAVLLDAAGGAWAWDGLLRRPSQSTPLPPLQRLPLPERVAAVACGWHHAALVGASGYVYTMGSNTAGQCGLPEVAGAATVDAPTRVTAFDGLTAHPAAGAVVAAACGAWHTAFLTTGGDVYTCGSGAHGQLGHDDYGGGSGGVVGRRRKRATDDTNSSSSSGGGGSGDNDVLAVVPALGAVPTALAAGCFPRGASERAPRLVGGLPLDDDVTHVAAGAAHTLASTRSGRLYVWGRACLPAPLHPPPHASAAASAAATTSSSPPQPAPATWGLQRYTPTPALVPLRDILVHSGGAVADALAAGPPPAGGGIGVVIGVTSLAAGWMHSDVTLTVTRSS